MCSFTLDTNDFEELFLLATAALQWAMKTDGILLKSKWMYLINVSSDAKEGNFSFAISKDEVFVKWQKCFWIICNFLKEMHSSFNSFKLSCSLATFSITCIWKSWGRLWMGCRFLCLNSGLQILDAFVTSFCPLSSPFSNLSKIWQATSQTSFDNDAWQKILSAWDLDTDYYDA